MMRDCFAKPDVTALLPDDATGPSTALVLFMKIRRELYHCVMLVEEMEKDRVDATGKAMLANATRRLSVQADLFEACE